MTALPFGPKTARDVTPKSLAGTAYTITRQIRNYAYPKNGNLDNPTPNYLWTVNVNGKAEGDFWNAKDARDFVKALRDGSLA